MIDTANNLTKRVHFLPALVSSSYPPSSPSLQSPSHPVVADTGANGHFITQHTPHTNKQPMSPGINVLLPNGDALTSTHTANLILPGLPPSATTAHIFPSLASGSLLSIGVLCDHGCTATFTKDDVSISHNNKSILTGQRAPSTGLWTMTLPPPPQANIIINNPNIASRIAFYHAAMFSPAISTWCAAIDKGFLSSFPGLTSAQVRRHLPDSEAMIKGHLDQERANVRSTKTPPFKANATTHLPQPASSEISAPPQRTHILYTECHEATGKIFSDPTGRFLTPSTTGISYILVVYDYDSNYIHAEPMLNRTKEEHVRALKQAINLFKSRGLTPQLHKLDNEASALLQDYMHGEHIEVQLVPPGLHRRNAAERAIRTFKNHLIAGLCSTDPNFPLKLWDKVLPQALLTLNIMRASRLNPLLSAHSQLYGFYDFNKNPIAPPGTKVQVHEKPALRGTWAPHSVDGWYLGPSMKHYRCFKVWVNDTIR